MREFCKGVQPKGQAKSCDRDLSNFVQVDLGLTDFTKHFQMLGFETVFEAQAELDKSFWFADQFR